MSGVGQLNAFSYCGTEGHKIRPCHIREENLVAANQGAGGTQAENAESRNDATSQTEMDVQAWSSYMNAHVNDGNRGGGGGGGNNKSFQMVNRIRFNTLKVFHNPFLGDMN